MQERGLADPPLADDGHAAQVGAAQLVKDAAHLIAATDEFVGADRAAVDKGIRSLGHGGFPHVDFGMC